MPRFGTRSKKRLSSCHPDLQKVFNKVIEKVDCSILCGHRGEEAQNEAYEKGNSKVKYPNGRHNAIPSNAVDVAPYPIEWDNLERFTLFAGYVLGIAESMKIDLIWGNDWDGDFDTKDTGFRDYPHFELKMKKK
tara:strand:+ start:170 stop:571 length:402 start_codon:yes stop_codon:yes gene_type:complete